ncbi:SRPBCC domain-containing protein [Deinococcus radiomollis]|uniref:SRPBCC family protein n=1 Tax=Deinococcus radiomollis TaxID=468916 RepID=UPI0038924522
MTTTETTPLFTLSRTFRAPRELVFRAWTQPEHLAQWMSSAGMTQFSTRLDLRPGGLFHYGLKTQDGQELWGKWIFREIEAPSRLVFVSSFSDAAGGLTRHPMAAQWPLETLSTVTFTEQEGKTLLTLTATPIGASEPERQAFAEALDGMDQGWGVTFAQLETYLAGAQA